MKSLQLKKPTQISSEDTGNSSKPIIYKDVRCHSESKVSGSQSRGRAPRWYQSPIPTKKKEKKKGNNAFREVEKKKYIKYTTLQKYINTCNC